jgi:hypothetical protein
MTFAATGKIDIPGTQPGMGGEVALVEVRAEVERGGDTAAHEHALAGNGAGEAVADAGQVAAGGFQDALNSGDGLGVARQGLRVGVGFDTQATQEGVDRAEGQEQDQEASKDDQKKGLQGEGF